MNNATTPHDRPLTVKDAAEYLGVSTSMIYKLTHRRKIAFHKPGGKKIYFRKKDLDDYAFMKRIESMLN